MKQTNSLWQANNLAVSQTYILVFFTRPTRKSPVWDGCLLPPLNNHCGLCWEKSCRQNSCSTSNVERQPWSWNGSVSETGKWEAYLLVKIPFKDRGLINQLMLFGAIRWGKFICTCSILKVWLMMLLKINVQLQQLNCSSNKAQVVCEVHRPLISLIHL